MQQKNRLLFLPFCGHYNRGRNEREWFFWLKHVNFGMNFEMEGEHEHSGRAVP